MLEAKVLLAYLDWASKTVILCPFVKRNRLRRSLGGFSMAMDKDGICPKCNGTGKFLYANTATWKSRPGIVAGRAMTWDTCNMCWGTGDINSPGPDLMKAYLEKKSGA